MAGEKILLVDDEPGIRKVLSISLADSGYEVRSAPDGEAALALFREERPDIVLADIKMPGMDGVELLRRIKEEGPDTEVIMITGHGDMELAVRSLKLEATDFIQKPIRDDQLEIALKRARERIGYRAQIRNHTENLERLVKEQAEKLVEAERLAAVGQALEGLVAAMSGIAGDMQNGIRFFNEIPCMVSIHSRDLKIVSANRLHREKLGDILGHDSGSIYESIDATERVSPAQHTFSEKKGVRERRTLCAADGTRLPVVVYTAPIKSDRGEVELVVEIAADVDEIRRLQKELAAAREHLATLGLLLGSVSHGIKGLLTRLDAGSYLLDGALASSDKEGVDEARRIIRMSAERIKKMVMDVLFYAKERDLECEETDLSEFARDTAQSVEARFFGPEVRLSTDFSAASGKIAADTEMLRSALINILQNAADACLADKAKSRHEVTFIVSADAWSAFFEITDNGVGIDENTREKLFTLFFSSKGKKGTGLGLFIAREIVLKHGGEISVSSRKGEGSSFSVRIPRNSCQNLTRASEMDEGGGRGEKKK